MSVSLDGQTKGTGQTEISELDHLARSINEQVLWLQIAMENTMLVKVDKCLQNLVEERLGLLLWQWLVSVLSHVLLQVELHIFKDQVELLLRVDDLNQAVCK